MNMSKRPHRVLIVLPNWVGDAVMATPALQVMRDALPGAFIAGLCTPGIDDVLSGLACLDELIPIRASGVMATKHAAQLLRPRRFDCAVLMTNSFSTALTTRIAGIPQRIGFDRDGRGLLLTEHLKPQRRRDVSPFNTSETDPGAWAPVPAVTYYLELAHHLIGPAELAGTPRLALHLTDDDRKQAAQIFERAGINDEDCSRGLAMLNPGGNNEAKRWPAERFGAIANHLAKTHGWTVLINGSPGEAALAREVAQAAGDAPCICLPEHGITLGALKAIVAQCKLMVTNDTGPRHIAAAFGAPTVSLFGPTDHRWTTIPHEAEAIVLADPTLPACEVANDHAERCAIERIEVPRVIEACEGVIGAAKQG